jgi:hypothetical protein
MTRTVQHGFFEGEPDCPYTDVLDSKIEPLKNMSRDIRVAAIDSIPKLIDLLKETALEAIEKIEKVKTIEANTGLKL